MNSQIFIQVEEAVKFEGPLREKKSDSSKYHDRYGKIIDNGLVFAYAEKKEDFKKDDICGRFFIKDIIELQSDKLEGFNILTEDHLFRFQAPTFELREKWIKNLELLYTLATKRYKN